MLERDFASYRTIALIAIGVAGAAVAWIIVFWGYWSGLGVDWSEAQKDFARDGQFLLWLVLILAQAAVWPIAIILVVPTIIAIIRAPDRPRTPDLPRAPDRPRPPGRWGEIGLSAVVFVVAALAVALLGALGPDLPDWLPAYEWKLVLLSCIGIGAALVPAIGIWKAQVALRQLLREVGDAVPDKRQLDRLLHLRSALTLFLGLLGTLLSLAVVAAAAQRQAVEAFGKRTNADYDVDTVFPTHYVTLYGLLLSLLVVLAYVPADLTLRSIVTEFRDKVVPMADLPVDPNDPNGFDPWEKRVGQRQAFADAVGPSAALSTSLTTAIVVLTPLLASLTGLIGD